MLTINDILKTDSTPVMPDHIGRVVAAWDDDNNIPLRCYLQYIKYNENRKVYGCLYEGGLYEDSTTGIVVEYQNVRLLDDNQCKHVVCKEGTCRIIARLKNGDLVTTIGIKKPEELLDFNWELYKHVIETSNDK